MTIEQTEKLQERLFNLFARRAEITELGGIGSVADIEADARVLARQLDRASVEHCEGCEHGDLAHLPDDGEACYHVDCDCDGYE